MLAIEHYAHTRGKRSIFLYRPTTTNILKSWGNVSLDALYNSSANNIITTGYVNPRRRQHFVNTVNDIIYKINKMCFVFLCSVCFGRSGVKQQSGTGRVNARWWQVGRSWISVILVITSWHICNTVRMTKCVENTRLERHRAMLTTSNKTYFLVVKLIVF